MTLEEAIRINSETADFMSYPDLQDKRDAILLANEAAKAWKSSRDFSGINHFPLLPGETEE